MIMLKNLKAFLLSASAYLLTLAAIGTVNTTCAIIIYEPDIPESIKRDL